MCRSSGYTATTTYSNLAWILAVIVVVFTVTCDAITPLKYMTNSCRTKQPLYVNSSIKLELTHDLAEDRAGRSYRHCAVDILVDRGSTIYLHILVLGITDDSHVKDRLHIYDFNDDRLKIQRTPNKGLYGVYERPYYPTNTNGQVVQDYRSSGSKFRIEYLGIPTFMYPGFEILLTSVKEPKRRTGGCKSGYFRCPKQHICIPGELRCDGQPNCGLYDNTDEDGCAELDEMVTDLLSRYSVSHAIIAAVVSIIVFLLCVALIAFLVTKYNNKHYPLIKARALLRNGVCSVRTNLDMERLYAPPSYEHVMAGTSSGFGTSGFDPPPEYSEYVKDSYQRRGHYSDSDDESSYSVNMQNEYLDNQRHSTYRSVSRTSEHKAQCHDRPSTPEHLRPSTSGISVDHRPPSASSGESRTSSGCQREGDGSIGESENEVKSGDSGIEHSRENITKTPQKTNNIKKIKKSVRLE